MTKNSFKVVELFAGVGGFRLGLEGWKGKSASSRYHKKLDSNYQVIWGNQWEPSTKKQEAYEVYAERFEGKHSNEDIQKIIEEKFDKIPDHDLLVGGFPCQDYSVARTLNQAKGLKGKKGVLWWSIHAILEGKGKKAPKYLMLENVDRLLKSPSTQRGRDFAIMLTSLSDLGYAVEWRVVNAAEYGMPQRRRRVFFIGYHKSTDIYKQIKSLSSKQKEYEWLLTDGVIANALPVAPHSNFQRFSLSGTLADLTNNFNKGLSKSPFHNSGLMIDRIVYTMDNEPRFAGKSIILGDIIETDETRIPKEYYIDKSSEKKWNHLKGAKKLKRVNKSGFEYDYAEGAMIFPDSLDKASRTIITAEGGSSPSRFKHVIQSPGSGLLRRLLPVELERLNMFPDNHTEGASDIKRAFFMGNALVIGIVEKLGKALSDKVQSCAKERKSKVQPVLTHS